MKTITSLLFVMICRVSFANIGETIPEMVDVHGKYSDVWKKEIPGLKTYCFEIGDVRIRAIPLEGKVESITVEYSLDTTNDLAGLFLGELEGTWKTNDYVSNMELMEFDFRTVNNHPIKMQLEGTDIRAYLGRPSAFDESDRRLVICSGKYLSERARLIAKSRIRECVEDYRIPYGYHAKSVEPLMAFFEKWHKESRPVKRNMEKLPAIINEAYEVFQKFYDPTKPKHTGGKQFFYAQPKYIIVQNELTVMQVKKFNQRYGRHYSDFATSALVNITINNFRPKINVDGMKAVYLTEEKKYVLTRFLGEEQLDMGHGSIMAPARARADSQKRKEFLSHAAPIIHGHWNGWHLVTHPEVSAIVLNEDLSQACVEFRLGYRGGETVFNKKNGIWELESSQLTWIE